jgi:hypothetical protein
MCIRALCRCWRSSLGARHVKWFAYWFVIIAACLAFWWGVGCIIWYSWS